MLIPMHTVIIFFCIISTSTARARKRMRKKSSYLMPATPLAQSSEPPDAAYCKHVVHYHLYHFIIIIYTLSYLAHDLFFFIKIRNIFWINIVWWELTIVLIPTICTQSLWWGRHSSGSLNVRWILQEWFETFKYCLLTWISEAVPIT